MYNITKYSSNASSIVWLLLNEVSVFVFDTPHPLTRNDNVKLASKIFFLKFFIISINSSFLKNVPYTEKRDALEEISSLEKEIKELEEQKKKLQNEDTFDIRHLDVYGD